MPSIPSHPLPYLARHKRWLGLGIGALVLTNGLAQAIPWVIKRTIDTMERLHQSGSDAAPVIQLALVAGGLAIAQAISRIVSRIYIFNSGREAEYELRREIFAHLCRLDGPFYRRFRVGDLMSRVTNDLASVRSLFGAGMLHGINTIFAYAIAIPVMVSIDGALTLWAMLPYPVMLLATKTFARGIYQRSRDQQQSLSAMTAAVQEDLAGIREIKSYRLENRRADDFSATSKQYLSHAVRLAAWRATMFPFVGLGAAASLVLVLWIGGQRVVAGDLSLGDLVALNLYVGMLAWPTMAIGWTLSLWQRGISGWHRLIEILSTEPELSDRAELPGPANMHLACEGLSLSLGGERNVLDGIDLEIEAGELCAIVGRVGSGKTTLAEVLARLSDVAPGALRYGGTDATELSTRKTRAHIAYAPQDAFLFSATLYENVAFGIAPDAGLSADQERARVAQAVRAAGLEADLDALPNGLQTVVGERGISLSGGQRQRVALARALVSGRPLLILDDSLSAVDAETEKQILKQLKQLLKDTTTILVSHRLSALKYADRVIVLEDGKVSEQGTHAALLAAGGAYTRLYERQLLAEGLEA